MTARNLMSRKAFSLVEILVVMAIVAVMVGLLLSSVQQVREAVGRAQCTNNMKQLGIAIHHYHDTYGVFPNENVDEPNTLLYVTLQSYLEEQGNHGDAVASFLCSSRRNTGVGDKIDYAAASQGTMGNPAHFSILGGCSSVLRSATGGAPRRGQPIGGFWSSLNPGQPYHYFYVTWGLPEFPAPDATNFLTADRLVGGFTQFNKNWFRGWPAANGQDNRLASFWIGGASGVPQDQCVEFGLAMIQGPYRSFDQINPGMGSDFYHGCFGLDWGLGLTEAPGLPPVYPWLDTPFSPGNDPRYTGFFPGDYHNAFSSISFVIPAWGTVSLPAVTFPGIGMTDVSHLDGTATTILLSHKELNASKYSGGDDHDGSFRESGRVYNYQRDVIDRPPVRDKVASSPGTGFGSPHNTCVSLFADGSVRSVSYQIPGQLWTALWTYNGNERAGDYVID